MSSFNPEFLKQSAVRVATQFLTAEKPLSSGIAEVATEYSLNNEQIKRLIEVVNQVTYLKLLPTVADRTFEFPLAKYEEVLSIMTSPESVDMTDNLKPSPLAIVTGDTATDIIKVAYEQDSDPVATSRSEQEKLAYLKKHVYSARGRLEKIAEREVLLLDEIQRIVPQCRADEDFMDKVAMVTDGDEDTLTKISSLVYNRKKEWSSDGLFYDSELEQAEKTVGLLKEAFSLVEERKNIEAQLEKLSFFAPLAATIASRGAQAAAAAKTVGGNTSKWGKRAWAASEPTIFAADRTSKKDVWKSLQGPRAPRNRT